jgi:REP element-mobilizing transposase RayT
MYGEKTKSSEYLHKSHNVSVLIYHFVCPAKYRRVVFDKAVDEVLKEVCQEIELRYDIRFLEIGTDKDHVHFLIQSAPKISATQIIRTVKSITAKEVFARCPQVKKKLWGGEFWSDGYYVGTVGQHGNEETISNYVRNQGKEAEYKSMLRQPLQLSLFDWD